MLAIAFFCELQIEELWVSFGTGNHYRMIAEHSIARQLGPRKVAALPFFHSFTGCDTTSAFAGRGEKTCWDVWRVYPDVTEAFLMLSDSPHLVSQEAAALIEKFVVYIYSKTLEVSEVNEARQILFSKENRSLENIPPTQAALFEYICRAGYQAGHVLGKGC